MRKMTMCILVAAALVALPQLAHAQYDAEYWTTLNLNFQNPGARSHGFGGAFTALADDATAAYVNPAGIAFLDDWQMTVQYKGGTTSYDAGRKTFDEDGTDRGFQEVKLDQNYVNFAAILFPLAKGKLTGGLFYTNLFDTEKGRSKGDDTFGFIAPTSIPNNWAYYPTWSAVAAKAEVYGISIGWRLSDDLSAGVMAGESSFDFFGRSRRFVDFQEGSNNWNQQSSYISDKDIMMKVGGLWTPSDKWSIGFTWQSETSYKIDSWSSFPDGSSGVWNSTFTIPTRHSLGVAYKVNDSWVITGELDRIQYSDMFKQMDHGFFDWDYVSDTFIVDDGPQRFSVDDVTEIHLGTEYTKIHDEGGATYYRFGFWQDKSHLPYYDGNHASDSTETDADRAVHPKVSDSINHFTAGLGFSVNSLMFDLAVDYASGGGTTYYGSTVIRF